MPPALPRPPACTCAFTTTRPPSRPAMARAWAGVSATSPPGTGTLSSRSSAFAWYSWIFTGQSSSRRLPGAAGDLPDEPHDRVDLVGHPLLQRDDRVVGDVDVLGTHLGAALGDVAEADAALLPDELAPVVGVERVHLQLGVADEHARPREARLVLLVVADHVADVLAQEALDALVELLCPVDVPLLHPVGAVGLLGAGLEGRHALGHLVVEGDVGDQVADDREGLDRGDRDGLGGVEEVQAGHAQQ